MDNDRGICNNEKQVLAQQQSFGEVQGMLERNRLLIQEIDQNHEAREAGGLSRNIALICEFHSNTARIMKHYTDLSSSFFLSLSKGSHVVPDIVKRGCKRKHPPQ